RGLAPDVEVVLHPALGGQTVVVPPDRVEHFPAAHALEPRDGVGMGERADVPDVQLPADRQRRSIDREDVATRGGAVKPVLPPTLPTCATTSPRCRQARACPARGWPAARAARGRGGSRCSWRPRVPHRGVPPGPRPSRSPSAGGRTYAPGARPAPRRSRPSRGPGRPRCPGAGAAGPPARRPAGSGRGGP